jgi:hypothetical protein
LQTRPTVQSPSVVRERVIVTASTVKVPCPFFTTVRQAPSTAMLSPMVRPRYGAAMVRASPRAVRLTRVAFPSAVTIPVNIRSDPG